MRRRRSGRLLPHSGTTTSGFAFLGWVAFALLFTFALLIGGGYDGIYWTTDHGSSAWSLIAVVLVGWALVAWRRSGVATEDVHLARARGAVSRPSC